MWCSTHCGASSDLDLATSIIPYSLLYLGSFHMYIWTFVCDPCPSLLFSFSFRDVGRITVCYGTCLQSPVLWVRSYHQDCIIFGFSFYIQNLAKILVELEIWIFKSDPSLVVDIFLNQDYSGDYNGGICVIIPALGDENRDLPCFCLPTLPRKSPWGLGSYYTPLERYSWGDCSAVGIVGNGSVVVEKFREQVWQYGFWEGNWF